MTNNPSRAAGVRPYPAPTQARGETRLFITLPPIWRKPTQRVILEMMVRHPDKTYTDIAAIVFTRGVTALLDEQAKTQRRRAEDFTLMKSKYSAPPTERAG